MGGTGNKYGGIMGACDVTGIGDCPIGTFQPGGFVVAGVTPGIAFIPTASSNVGAVNLIFQ